jgi:hypothetical protein
LNSPTEARREQWLDRGLAGGIAGDGRRCGSAGGWKQHVEHAKANQFMGFSTGEPDWSTGDDG